MSDKGAFIGVELADLARDLPDLVREVRQNGRRVRLVERGSPVADLTPVVGPAALPVYPELGGVRFNADPAAPVPDEDWPASAR